MHSLTDTKIRSLTPSEKTQRHFDGGGLYLELSPKGGKWWRFKYRLFGKEKRLSLGTYPDTALKAARERAQQARKLAEAGVDPGAARKAVAASRAEAISNSFEAISREWLSTVHMLKVCEAQSNRTIGRLERDVFPWIGSTAIDTLKAPEILKVMRRVETRGAIETAHRELQVIGQVFRYAVATGRAERDPSADLKGALRPFTTTHMPAITEPARAGALMRAIDGYEGTFVVRCALQLVALTFVRSGELRFAAWDEIALDEATWRIPGHRMKRTKAAKANGPDHLVPLSIQAVRILTELQPLTGHRPHVFPSMRGEGRVLSDATLGAALRRLGFSNDEMTAHGFRAMARTMLVERLNVDESIVEAQLAHRVKDALGRAYNRTQFVDQRRVMLQTWADYLDALRAGVGVRELRKAV